MIVFLGPDGVGKTTAVKLLQEGVLGHIFKVRKSFHFRTQRVKASSGVGAVRDPHGKPPRGLILSLAKLGMWWMEYTVGYLLDVRPQLTRGGIVFFDRYVHDLLIDQRRYRYGAPVTLLRWMARCVPQPDLVIVLDAPAEVIQARKQDITFEETCRQREAYAELARRSDRGHIVDAARPAAEVAADIERVVLEFLSQRARR